MTRLFLVINSLAVLIILSHSGIAEDCETYQLDTIPYRSSYLPRSIGPLTNLFPIEGENEVHGRPQALETFRSTTVMERLDEVVNLLIGVKSNTQQAYNESPFFYNPSARSWEGHCNVWAGNATLNSINRYLQDIGNRYCGDIIITQGEIEELFTAFGGRGADQVLGHKVRHVFEDEEVKYLTNSGTDSLDPQMFDQFAMGRLKNNKSFVIDTTSDLEVWNYPVYKVKRCGTEIISKNSASNKDRWVPVFLVKDSEVAAKLSKADRAMASSDEGKDFQQIAANLNGVCDTLKLTCPTLYTNMHSIRSVRSQIDTHLRENSGVLAPDKYQVRQINLELTYQTEDNFGQSSSKEDGLKNKTYQYLQYTDPETGQTIGNHWITAADERPDFVWSTNLSMAITKNLENLNFLLNQCAKENDVSRIYALVAKSYINTWKKSGESEMSKSNLNSLARLLKPVNAHDVGLISKHINTQLPVTAKKYLAPFLVR